MNGFNVCAWFIACCGNAVRNFPNRSCKIACHFGCRSSFGFTADLVGLSNQPIIFHLLVAALRT